VTLSEVNRYQAGNTKGFIKQKYQEFVQENIQNYLRNFSEFSIWLSRIDRRLLNEMLLKRKYDKNQLLAMQNFIEYETHRELVFVGLKIRKNLRSDS